MQTVESYHPVSCENLINRFHMLGISYQNSDVKTRGRFAVDEKTYKKILSKSYPGIEEFMILSTCNRTEIYAVCHHPELLSDVICNQSPAKAIEFKNIATGLRGEEAVKHLFSVVSGLSSQILGDYEISGQFRKAAKLSKEFGHIGSCLERMANTALQVSKNIKNLTKLSDGSVSVSFATVQFLKSQFNTFANKKILLVGLGKIGGNTCKNILDYTDANQISVCNRSHEKAVEFAGNHKVDIVLFEELKSKLNEYDILIFATGSQEAILCKEDITSNTVKTIVDLSIPCNVNPDVADLPQVNLVNVDSISYLKDDTLQRRKDEVPKAEAILCKYFEEFKEWANHRQFAGSLKTLKCSLEAIALENQHHQVNQLVRQAAKRLKTKNFNGCEHINVINQLILQEY
jgi:glutamyl-tRNA reductase